MYTAVPSNIQPLAIYPAGVAQTLALILDLVRHSAAARLVRDRARGPMVVLLWARLARLAVRFAALVARVEAGRGAPRRRAARPPEAECPGPATPPKPRESLPRNFGWLVRLVGHEAAAGGSQLQHLLSQPEMAALLAAAPQAARLLRPLCRMLAVPLAAVPILGPPPARKPRRRSPSPNPLPEGEGFLLPFPWGEGRGEGRPAARIQASEPGKDPPDPGLASFRPPRFFKGR